MLLLLYYFIKVKQRLTPAVLVKADCVKRVKKKNHCTPQTQPFDFGYLSCPFLFSNHLTGNLGPFEIGFLYPAKCNI